MYVHILFGKKKKCMYVCAATLIPLLHSPSCSGSFCAAHRPPLPEPRSRSRSGIRRRRSKNPPPPTISPCLIFAVAGTGSKQQLGTLYVVALLTGWLGLRLCVSEQRNFFLAPDCFGFWPLPGDGASACNSKGLRVKRRRTGC